MAIPASLSPRELCPKLHIQPQEKRPRPEIGNCYEPWHKGQGRFVLTLRGAEPPGTTLPFELPLTGASRRGLDRGYGLHFRIDIFAVVFVHTVADDDTGGVPRQHGEGERLAGAILADSFPQAA